MLERLRDELATFARNALGRVPFLGLTPGTVRAQAGDGTLDVVLDPGAALPELVGVPIRHGLPGVTAISVGAGARVRVGFDGADPRRPFAVLWDAGNATSVTLNGSTRQLARTNDTTANGYLLTAAGSVVGYIPPGTPLPDPLPPGATGSIALSGIITGTSHVRG